jgi:hypothetical protein
VAADDSGIGREPHGAGQGSLDQPELLNTVNSRQSASYLLRQAICFKPGLIPGLRSSARNPRISRAKIDRNFKLGRVPLPRRRGWRRAWPPAHPA